MLSCLRLLAFLIIAVVCATAMPNHDNGDYNSFVDDISDICDSHGCSPRFLLEIVEAYRKLPNAGGNSDSEEEKMYDETPVKLDWAFKDDPIPDGGSDDDPASSSGAKEIGPGQGDELVLDYFPDDSVDHQRIVPQVMLRRRDARRFGWHLRRQEQK
jgi:hypothetical protein